MTISIHFGYMNGFLLCRILKLKFVNGLRSSPRMVQIHFLMRFSDAASNFRLDMCLLKKFFTPKIFLLGFPRRGAIGGYWVSHGKKYK